MARRKKEEKAKAQGAKKSLRKVSISWASTTTPWLSAMAAVVEEFVWFVCAEAGKEVEKRFGGVEQKEAL